MHAPDHPAKRQRQPMTPAERQRKKRKLDSGGYERVMTRYSSTVTEALYWQAIDAGMTEEEATAVSTDKAKIAEGLSSNHEQWAINYLTERAKRA